jgi:hypothetical protein
MGDVTSKKTETGHEVLAAVLQIRDETLQVLLWQRAQQPDSGRWALPGGALGDTAGNLGLPGAQLGWRPPSNRRARPTSAKPGGGSPDRRSHGQFCHSGGFQVEPQV